MKTNTRMQKWLCLLLAVLMMAVMASCGKKTPDAPTPDSGNPPANTGDDGQTAEPVKEQSAINDSNLPKKDYSDETFVIRYADKTTFVPDTVNISKASASKDVISKAGYERDAAFERLVGAEISYELSHTNPNSDSASDGEMASIRNLHLGGDLAEYDMLMVGSRTAGSMIAESLFTDLNQYDNYIKTGAYYYSKGFNDGISIGNKQLAATGYYTTLNVGWTHVTTVNNSLLTEVSQSADKIGELYELVLDHAWTLEELMKCGETYATGSVDEDVTTGRYTWVVGQNPSPEIFYAAGGTSIEMDEQNLPVVTVNNTANIDLLTYLRTLFEDRAIYIAPNDTESMVFNNKNSLFLTAALTYASSMEDTIGAEGRVLPLPLYQKGDEYVSVLSAWCANVAGIPAIVEDPEMAAYCYEAYMALSYDYVYPQFFEKIFKVQYANNPVEAQIFDIIAESAVIPMVEMYRWTTGSRNPIRDMLTSTVDGGVGSSASSMAADVEAHIQEFFKNYKFN